jgi:hypothetical protein
MGELVDRLNRVIIQEYSPDGGITAIQQHQNQVTLEFRSGAYRRYSEAGLEAQLAALADAVRISCQRSFYETISDFTGRSITAREAAQQLDGADRRLHEAQRELRVEVTSPGGWITGETQGLDRWQIRIRDGALRTLSEEEFVAEATAGLRDLLGVYRDRDRDLRDEFLDLRLPKGDRDDRRRY